MPDKTLRLLCVEDNQRDVKLIAKILSQAGYLLDLDSVHKAVAFGERLAAREYDLVLCDFNLNDWTAIEALEILRATGRDIPFVVLSGSLGDEAAVECIKLGATDYVLKDRMARLPLAIQRALEAKAARDEQRRGVAALKESAEQYRLLFEGNPNPTWVYDIETLAILAVNDAAVRHYGYTTEEFLSMTMSDLRSPEDVPEFLAAHAANAHVTVPMGSTANLRHRKKNGEIIEVEVAGSPTTFQGRAARLGLANDISERKSLQAQLLQAQKMESIGRLAGGVAHDLNNLMGVVLGYGELTLEDLAATSPLRKNVMGMQSAAERAVGIVRQLLAFSRKQIQWPRMLNLNAVVKDMEDLLSRLIGEDIRMTLVVGSHLGTVKADPGLIEQVIMNLAVNARDAMPNGGDLTIRTVNVELENGPHVLLEICDTGCGMDAATQAHIFEPFFTTKTSDKGTGLGLATVYGIIKQSGGSISVHSLLGQGATFSVCFPRVEAVAQPPRVQKAVQESGTAKGTETILLAEDAKPLRDVVVQFLKYGGYNVLVADSGIAALVTAQQYCGHIHLLLTDVVMPGLSGPELAKSLGGSHPDMSVVYMSGYTDETLAPHGVLEAGVTLIEKPFTRESLLRKLRQVLDRASLRTSADNRPSTCLVDRHGN